MRYFICIICTARVHYVCLCFLCCGLLLRYTCHRFRRTSEDRVSSTTEPRKLAGPRLTMGTCSTPRNEQELGVTHALFLWSWSQFHLQPYLVPASQETLFRVPELPPQVKYTTFRDIRSSLVTQDERLERCAQSRLTLGYATSAFVWCIVRFDDSRGSWQVHGDKTRYVSSHPNRPVIDRQYSRNVNTEQVFFWPGHLQFCIPRWEIITQDKWILQTL